MSNYKDEDYSKIDEVPILRGISMLGSLTKLSFDHSAYIERAFLLGLWHRSFPEYMQGDLETVHRWNYEELDLPYNGHILRFAFISDTGDSWHAVYRDLRNRGWQRSKVHRDGGRLQYLFKISGEILQTEPGWYPKGFDEIHLVLDISISTCKQVQVGTEMKAVPIMKTVCEDLVELPDDHLIKDIKESETVEMVKIAQTEEPKAIYGSAEVVPLIVVDDIELDAAPEPRCDHGNLSGCCPISDCQFFIGEDSIPF